MNTLEDFEIYALDALDRNAKDYYRSGANFEHTLRNNMKAFWRLRLRPRMLRDVSQRLSCVSVLGFPISFPVGIAPTAAQKMASPGGEKDSATAAKEAGTIMILSTLSTTSIEDVASDSPGGLRWFQLYVFQNRNFTLKLIRRAEKAKFKALVVTTDTPFFGSRTSDKDGFKLPPHLRFANLDDSDLSSERLDSLDAISKLLDPKLTWGNIKWLQSVTDLPIIVKGILTAEDAKLAVEYGCAGIIVSNHGGRQLDTVPATIEALPEVVRAVEGSDVEVYMDGGIRNGTDVFKAVAMGARAVFIGRPILWGLTVAEKRGARRVLEILRKEFDFAMGLSGIECVGDITPSHVVLANYYDFQWKPEPLYCPAENDCT